jgi:(p)ppGpp synthase/HD superfamily hydrolase
VEHILDQVRQYATIAHEGQVRKYAPDPFVVHPIRVMNTCRVYSNDVCLLSAALLHDVIEDTPITRNEMHDFLLTIMPPASAHRTVTLVEQLTDVYIKSNYPNWNRRKRKRAEIKRLSAVSADAQTIKYADVIDNCIEISHNDPEFAGRFLSECWDLLQAINKGNTILYQKALKVVKTGIEELRVFQRS